MANRTYNGNDMMRMRQEAIRQARQMHSKAVEAEKDEQEKALPPNHETSPEDEVKTSPVKKNKTLLEQLGIDREQAVILVLIVLLMNEGSDNKLILALCYLLI